MDRQAWNALDHKAKMQMADVWLSYSPKGLKKARPVLRSEEHTDHHRHERQHPAIEQVASHG